MRGRGGAAGQDHIAIRAWRSLDHAEGHPHAYVGETCLSIAASDELHDGLCVRMRRDWDRLIALCPDNELHGRG